MNKRSTGNLVIWVMLIIGLLSSTTGCKSSAGDYVTYQARGFILYDGLTAVMDAELINRNLYDSSGHLKHSSTRLWLTNRSGFAIETDLELFSAYWSRRVSTTYLADGDTLDLGIVSYDPQAFASPITIVWHDLDYYWINIGVSL